MRICEACCVNKELSEFCSTDEICEDCREKIAGILTLEEQNKERNRGKKYREKNREKINAQKREHYRKNKERISQEQKDYYEQNKQEVLDRNKQYRDANKDKIAETSKKYVAENKDRIAAYKKEWKEKNRDHVNAWTRKRDKERRKTDINYKIKGNLRGRLYKAVKGLAKSDTTLKLLGCDIEHLKTQLESSFTDGMSWDNYGEWHIDHIAPCASFDLSNSEEQEECFHYTNLQPLWAEDNLKKGINA